VYEAEADARGTRTVIDDTGKRLKPLDTDVSRFALKKSDESALTIGTILWQSPARPPKQLSGNTVAKKKWNEVIEIFRSSGARWVTSADVETLCRYCLITSDFYALRKKLDEIRAAGDVDAEVKVQKILVTVSENLSRMETALMLAPAARLLQLRGAKGLKTATTDGKREQAVFGD
jgi:hypothetical protein